ncbi:efflux RND transporter periplasmic adaptor subunit [Acidithiobacillus caldus]|jgi:Cu(I)/Ag(I) efflux system membrane fusion protein|uniref:Efflux transporter periplasmic adaptor subunit n=1 Tax=Acidithiobacillus caldus TaxID=33059 RepID=A0A1E7YKX1_9PROT|nr:efflux RND transporter periplasmic adaptor subunit [Acidithiobacillus caldus]MBU2762313.1 efflux RND transporter periplasmic adaptor subunit [Acidithiobacillus caldus]MBU2769745.1 efflux RND transporter periplasmic adaptor subunit [Acidithiobacillus caldus]OFC30727.1 efflux transporter periplasmic adaptor subunit [Acidithiobacillus caldus]OFC32019.1 efflux transporter periplasmic adaptor subunit [Acidithiobacillus caldus]OFC36631.1 efflux transporter periplasmic adaptor subunit [Acidithioba
MNKRVWGFSLISLLVGTGIGVALVLWLPVQSPVSKSPPAKEYPETVHHKNAKPRILYWANPMNPAIHASHPMKDNMGMAYIPVYAHAPAVSPAGLSVDARMVQQLGVRVVTVRRRRIGRVLTTVGTVAVDENRVYSVTPRFSGWITNLAVRAVGDPVAAGSVLARVYSPEVYNAEQEYLLAQRSGSAENTGGMGLTAAATERLRLLGLSSAEIAALRRSGVAQRQVTIYAPASGVVQQLAFHQGGYLSAQSSLMEIANLDRVWVQVALYGYQLPWVRIGDRVELRSEEFPGKLWQGRLSFLYPKQNPQSRTVTARLSFANPDGVLRPGMYVTAQVWTQAHRVLAVPDSAILRTEQGNFVMLQQAAGHFLPVQVEVGPTADGWTAISRGLHAGEKVVDNTQFLLYSESQFQSVRARMLGGNLGSKHTARTTAEHASPTAPTSKNSSASGSMAGMHMGGGGHD